MTKGEFYAPYASRGLETYKIKEVERLLLRYPDIRDVLRECIIKHKVFYEKLMGLPLTDKKLKNDEMVQNILSLLRHFGSKFSLTDYIKLRNR